MQEYRPGEIVLLSFPFADAAGAKRRPALVLIDTGDEDIVVARVTSQKPQTNLDIELVEWQQAGLLLPSVVRVHKLATVKKRLVEKRLGTVTPTDRIRAREGIRQLWSLF
jgi:mRNA interferase MazF